VNYGQLENRELISRVNLTMFYRPIETSENARVRAVQPKEVSFFFFLFFFFNVLTLVYGRMIL